jgi:hypothetical protein
MVDFLTHLELLQCHRSPLCLSSYCPLPRVLHPTHNAVSCSCSLSVVSKEHALHLYTPQAIEN